MYRAYRPERQVHAPKNPCSKLILPQFWPFYSDQCYCHVNSVDPSCLGTDALCVPENLVTFVFPNIFDLFLPTAHTHDHLIQLTI
jgi:hypothetical protein